MASRRDRIRSVDVMFFAWVRLCGEDGCVMNLVHACDDNFAEILGISIRSQYYLCRYPKSRIRPGDRGSACQFTRLFISRLLPVSCDRVLYLDSDTIVRHSLEPFYETSFDGNVVCGVMLVDLKAWRQSSVELKFRQIIKNFQGNVPYADQGILNLALRGKIKELRPRFNRTQIYTTLRFDELQKFRKPSLCPLKEELIDALKDPPIVHFTTLFCTSRPWLQNARGTFFDDWKYYKRISPWKDRGERSGRRKSFLKLAALGYRIVPKTAGLLFFFFYLHARIKPKFMRVLF